MTRIVAKAVSFTDDGYSTLLGFADDPSAPVNYVTLSMTNEPDEPDLNLDQGGVHIDAEALHVNGYNLVQDIRKTDAGVIVSRAGSVCLNSFLASVKWISAVVTPPPGLAWAG